MSMRSEIKATEAKLKNGKRYSYSFLALVTVRDWAGVEHLYMSLEDSLHGRWPGCNEDKETLRKMAQTDGYEITKW